MEIYWHYYNIFCNINNLILFFILNRRDCILQARSKARVRTCNIMIILSVLGFLISAITGKREVAVGETLFKRDQDWQENLRKEHIAESLAANKK